MTCRQGTNPPLGAIIDFWTKSKPDAKDVKITIRDGGGKQISTITPSSVGAGVNRVVWDMRYDRPVPADPRDIAQAIQFVALAGPRPNMGPADRGPIADPGDYTVEVSIGSNKSSKKFTVEEDPRVTWFSASDRAKRRTALNELMEMSKQADTQRKKFAATDSSLRALEASWRPDAAHGVTPVPENVKKMAESLRKSLDDLRPAFAGRGLTGPQLSPEERKEMLSRPEPEFVLQPIGNRVTQITDDVQSFSAAPSQTQLEQIALVKKAIADTSRRARSHRTRKSRNSTMR